VDCSRKVCYKEVFLYIYAIKLSSETLGVTYEYAETWRPAFERLGAAGCSEALVCVHELNVS